MKYRLISVRAVQLAVLFVLAYAGDLACAQPNSQHLFFHVTLDRSFTHPVSGRLLLFVAPNSGDATSVDMDMMSLTRVYVAAKELTALMPGDSVEIDADDVVFPGPFSQASYGSYKAQAVLDANHSYNYDGRASGDLLSQVISITTPIAGSAPSMTLSQVVPEPPDPLEQQPEVRAALQPINFTSPSLSRFWGRDISMHGWVLLPPGYDAHYSETYPTVYFTHGFGGTLRGMRARYAPMLYDRMKRGLMPPMIWVLLDESSPTGTHEFADGVNNGPWGTALTTELIPHLELTYRMDARSTGRFLQGHSSGGWATLWLQTRYPKIFGGTWSTSPDPGDFHFFSSVDLYAPHANMYRADDGTPTPMLRVNGKPAATMQQLAQIEEVIGAYGGQLASFDWVFSPRGPDGRPEPLFDRSSGEINPAVAAYRRSRYDIAEHLKANWTILGPDLKGKIHLFVGTDDTFYLDGAVHSLKATLDKLGGNAQITFLPGSSHFNVYTNGKDPYALFDQIASEMYAVARPGQTKSRSFKEEQPAHPH